MNRFIATIFSLLLLVITSSVQAQQTSPQASFDNANKLYQQKKFSEAATAYQQLIDAGYTSQELYFNAGNAYYKANQTGLAVYNFEKVLLRDPDNAGARHNLALANQRVEGYIAPLPLLFFQRWWIHWQQLHSPNGWATGALVLFWIFAVVLGLYLFANRFRQHTGIRWSSYVAGTLFGVYLLMSIGAYAGAHSHHTGIITVESVKMKTAPDQHSKELQDIKGGMKVEVLDSTSDFCKIELADGKTGWIACAAIKRL
ncbi:SH3 domain-containing protein [Chitinophaga pendula]|uniref:SH3 domain-containing protein n=1 Tax=Chitinophaga TaxID=79328 RepID=UPI000BB00A86|nr:MULTISPECIES: SH3 domain-containing protein [Chitinophaga]ASZ10291.1 hypothetical protein CK934_04495 [Chitinophaga sp. MD30]UCJ06747.1 SH3 domain-containing protein [Chitinophaga pendula]